MADFVTRMELTYSKSKDFSTDFTIEYFANPLEQSDLPSSLSVVRSDDDSIPASIFIPKSYYTRAELAYTKPSKSDIESSITVEPTSDLHSSIAVPKRHSARFTVEYFASPVYHSNLLSSGTVEQYDALPSSLRIPHSAELPISFEITEPPLKEHEFPPDQDAFVREAKAALNYGGAQTNQTGPEANGKQTQALYQFAHELDLDPGEVVEEAKLRLFKTNQTDTAVTLRFYTASKKWSETGVTWLNKPLPEGEPFLEVEIEPGPPGEIIIDVLGHLDLLSEPGFIIESSGLAVILTAKEFPDANRRPALLIYTRDYTTPGSQAISSEISVRGSDEDDLFSFGEVHSDWGFSSVEGSIFVHRSDYVYTDGVESSVTISRPAVSSSITVTQRGDEDLEAVLFVAEWDTEEISSSIGVPQKEVPSDITVRQSDESNLESSVSARQTTDSELYSWGGVTQPEIKAEVIVRRLEHNDLQGSVSVRALGRSEIPSKLVVPQREIRSEIKVRVADFDEVPSFGAVRATDESDMPSTLAVSNPEIISSISVRQAGSAPLPGDIAVRHSGHADVLAKVNVSRPDILGEGIVRQTGTNDLFGTIGVPIRLDEDFHSFIDVRSDFLKGDITVPERDEIHGDITVRQFDAGDLPSVLEVQSLYHKDGSRIVKLPPFDHVFEIFGTYVEWEAETPEGTAVTIETSIDQGQTWAFVPFTGAPIPQLGSGDSARGIELWVRQTLTSEDQRETPVLKWMKVTILTEGLDVPVRILADGTMLVLENISEETGRFSIRKSSSLKIPGRLNP